VLQNGGSPITAIDIDGLIQKVLLSFDRPSDRVIFAHSSDGGYINIRTGSDGSRPVYLDGQISDSIQVMYFSVPPNRCREGLYKRFVKSLESFSQSGMLWVYGVETSFLQIWLHDWDYFRRGNSFYKIIGPPLPALKQEDIDREIEESQQAACSTKRLRCWVKPR
jgi:hypothetical protein